ncbi:hypothetical protein [African swine fever virus]|nr:hypothetical protein [African swine fever virus]UNZ12499.1 hypothetical protein [African swine fever virus]
MSQLFLHIIASSHCLYQKITHLFIFFCGATIKTRRKKRLIFYQIPKTFYKGVYEMDHILMVIVRSKLFGENNGVKEFNPLMFG